MHPNAGPHSKQTMPTLPLNLTSTTTRQGTQCCVATCDANASSHRRCTLHSGRLPSTHTCIAIHAPPSNAMLGTACILLIRVPLPPFFFDMESGKRYSLAPVPSTLSTCVVLPVLPVLLVLPALPPRGFAPPPLPTAAASHGQVAPTLERFGAAGIDAKRRGNRSTTPAAPSLEIGERVRIANNLRATNRRGRFFVPATV